MVDSHLGTSTCGMTAGWPDQTCPLVMEAGRLLTPLPRKQARAPSAVAPPLSTLSAQAKSTSNMTRHLSLLRWVPEIVRCLNRDLCYLVLCMFISMIYNRVLWYFSWLCLLVLSFQVNSDKIYWQRNLDGTFSQFHSEKKAVGHCISTKAVGSDERADITHLYKHQEGTGKLIVLC